MPENLTSPEAQREAELHEISELSGLSVGDLKRFEDIVGEYGSFLSLSPEERGKIQEDYGKTKRAILGKIDDIYVEETGVNKSALSSRAIMIPESDQDSRRKFDEFRSLLPEKQDERLAPAKRLEGFMEPRHE